MSPEAITDIVVQPLAPNHWPVVERLFGPRGAGGRLLVHALARRARAAIVCLRSHHISGERGPDR